MPENTLQIVLEAKNLTAPAFAQLKKDLEASDISVKKVSAATSQAGKEMEGAFGKATQAGSSFVQGVGQGLGVAVPLSAAAAATAVVAFGVSSVKSFADFEKAMRAVNTVTGAVGAESQKVFEANSRQVRELAVRMGVDATGAAQALYEVLSAGIPQGREAFNVLEVGAKAAIGGLTTTKVAVDGLTSILNGYKLGASEAGRVSDQMFATVKIGKLNFEQLASSVGAVVPIASAVGVSFQEVGGFIANMTLAGNSASVSANSLRQIITSIIKPTDDAAKVAAALGLDFSEAGLRAKGLAGFLGEVEKATGGSTEVMGQLFSDVDGLKGVISSIGPNMDGFQKAIDGVGNSADSAEDAFSELNQSSARQWEEMAAKANELRLKVGESLIGPLGEIVKQVDNVGKALGLWPNDVPTRDQIQRMIELGTGTKEAAANANLLQKAWAFLVNQGAEANRVQAELYDPAKRAAAAAARTAAEDRLADAFRKGAMTATEYDKALDELAQARALVTRAEAQGNQLTEDQALAQLHAATAALEHANAQAEVAKAEADTAVQSGQAAKEKIAAYEAAQKAAKEAAAEAKRLAEEAARHEKQRAEDVAKANVDALESHRRFQREVRDVVADGNARVMEIRDKHDHDYNQAIVDAQEQQKRINADAAAAVVEINARADADIAQTGREWAQRREDIVRENGDRRADLERDAEDRITAISNDWHREREEKVREANDRRIDLERELADRLSDEVKDRERRLAREEEDARLARDERDEDRRLQREERGRGREDARKDAEKDLAEAAAEFKKDSASEAARHEQALREADDADARAKEEARHAAELAKLAERAEEEQAQIAARRDERVAAIDEQEKRQEEADKRRDEREAKHDELRRTREREDFERGQQNQRERLAEQLAALDARRDKELEVLARTKQAELDRVVETRDKTIAALEERQTKDLEALRVAKEAELAKAEDKRKADLSAIEERRERDITASNDALVKKQGQIDAARDADFAKFKADVGRRFRDMEQQFGDTMKRLEALVPDRVASLVGSAGQSTAAGIAALQGAASLLPTNDDPMAGEGTDFSAGFRTLQQAEDYYNQYGKPPPGIVYNPRTGRDVQWYGPHWYDYSEIPEEKDPGDEGLGAGMDSSLRPTSGLRSIFERLGRALNVTQRLTGGDARTLTGPPTPVSSADGASGALSWALGKVGSQDWNQMCERFVENAFGTTGRYASAKDAAASLLSRAGGTLADAPRGALVFFRPDRSNSNYGHVGISLGGGSFVSATSRGVSVDGATPYWSNLYQGHGLPKFAGGGVVPGAVGAAQEVIAHGGETIFNPDQMRVLGKVIGGGRAIEIDYDRLARALASVTVKADVDEVHNALLRKARSNGRGLGLG